MGFNDDFEKDFGTDDFPGQAQGQGQEPERTFQGLSGRWAMFTMGYGMAMGVLFRLIAPMAGKAPRFWILLNGLGLAAALSVAQWQALSPFLRRAGAFAKATFVTWASLTAYALLMTFVFDVMPTIMMYLGMASYFGIVLFPAYAQARVLEQEGVEGMGWILFHNLAVLASMAGLVTGFRLALGDMGGFNSYAMRHAAAVGTGGSGFVFGMSVLLLMLTLYSAVSGYYLERKCNESLYNPKAFDQALPPGRQFYGYDNWMSIKPVIIGGLVVSIIGLIVGLNMLKG